jgi:hypothetical protein
VNVQFLEWQNELAAGHTQHVQYHDWLSERIDDNRRLTREAAAAAAEQDKDRRLLANSLAGWGNGLNRPAMTKVVMGKDTETSTQLQIDAEKPPSPAPAAEQQRAPLAITSSDGPLLSRSIPHGTPLLPGTVTQFPQDFNSEGSESDRSNKSFKIDAEMELNYNGTSNEDDKQTSDDQPVRAESINHLNQPVHADQNIQLVPTEPINQIT